MRRFATWCSAFEAKWRTCMTISPELAGGLDRGQSVGACARPQTVGDQAIRGELRRSVAREHGRHRFWRPIWSKATMRPRACGRRESWACRAIRPTPPPGRREANRSLRADHDQSRRSGTAPCDEAHRPPALVIVDADTTPRQFGNELRWNAAYHHLRLGR